MNPIFDNYDLKILRELDRNARISELQLAKKIGKSREATRYRIKNLEKNGVIRGYSCWVDLAKLGYQGYKVYLKIKGNMARREVFIERLRTRQDIFWLGAADGAWDLGLTFFAKNHQDFYDSQNELFSEFGDLIIEKTTGVLVEVLVFGKKFLFPSILSESKPIALFAKPHENLLDELDYHIIRELLGNGRLKSVQLAKKISTTIDILRTRIKRLESLGIIRCYFAVIDHSKLGLEFYKTFLYFDTLSESDEKKIREFCTIEPNVIHLIRQISPWEMELEIMIETHQKYNELLNRLKKLIPENLRNVESAVMSQDYVFPGKKTIFD
ncbi:AsnC family transcriptional regulator [Candidatus Micrarchaeota archaeon]|nr:AsnC family transcriptional regulator [Candidatus Micrarchaeota archaeon]